MRTNRMTLSVLSIGLFLLMSGVIAAQGGTHQITWDAATGLALPAAMGETGDLDVSGPADGHIIIGLSGARDPIMTIFGQVEIDIHHSLFTILVDGLDPSHPFFVAGILPPSGQTQFSFAPFSSLSTVGDELHLQSLVLDPAVIGGYTLSNAIGVSAAAQAPVVHQTSPRMAGLGSPITVIGTNLGGASTGGIAPTVSISGQAAQLISHAGDLVTMQINAGSVSGYAEVSTPAGQAFAPTDAIDGYVVIPGASGTEASHAGIVLNQHTTIVGNISVSSELDSYILHMEVGEEAFVEVFPFDLGTYQIVEYSSATNGIACDPALAIEMPAYTSAAVALDDNGGPGKAAAVGLGYGPRFVAPFTGDYKVFVGSAFTFSTGGYLLNVRSRTPLTLTTPKIYMVQPNTAAPGSTLELIASGIDHSNPSMATAVFAAGPGTVSAPLSLNAAGNLEVVVPAGATTGQITLVSQYGIASNPSGDDTLSNLVIPGAVIPALVNLMPQTIGSGASVMGTIQNTTTPHHFLVSLNAGESLRAHCHPYDFNLNMVLPGAMFSPTILDPEIVIANAAGTTYYTSDAHSGAGMAAGFGCQIRPPWVAPQTGIYSILVRPWFFLSGGTYLLTVTID